MANVAYLTVLTPTAMIASNAIAVVSNILQYITIYQLNFKNIGSIIRHVSEIFFLSDFWQSTSWIYGLDSTCNGSCIRFWRLKCSYYDVI